MTPTPLIPRETLFGNPTRESPLIAPDGTRMAYLAPVDGVLNVWVTDMGQDNGRPVTTDTDRGIRHYFWTFDGKRILYIQDVGGDENWRLYATTIDAGVTECLTPIDGVQVQVIEYNKLHPHRMVVAINKDNPNAHDAYRLDLENGELTMVASNPGNIIGWVADPDLNVRAAQAASDSDGFDLLVRDTETSDWRTIVEWGAEDTLTSSPMGFTRDGRALQLIDSRDWNAGRLVQLDLATNAVTVIAEDPTYDVSSILYHPDTYDVQMVAFTRARRDWIILDESIRDDIDAIRTVNGGDFAVYDRTLADDIWLVGFTQDTGPVAYYAYDRSTRTSTLLFHNRPELLTASLAPMEPVSLPSRDGLTLHGYLTRPHDIPRGTPAPMVLNVHGGPWARDRWGYNAEAQWFANRGYVCLQINYRGSTGYGKQFLNAGDREWGGRMHDDLVDAVHWAVAESIADADRIAIYGGSYGGYAALVGVTRTPELFRCAVDIVGVSNLITFINSIPPYWSAFLDDLHRRVGHPEKDRDFLIERSPLSHVDNIQCPILIAQGANDPRVKQEESEQIVEAMKRKGIDYEYLLFEDEGHGFTKPENNLRFYAAAEKFLAHHLGGRVQE